MKTGIFITARLGSKRLERKHLLPVGGRPILYFLIKRIEKEFLTEVTEKKIKIVIVTSDEPENRAFENFVKEGVGVFYGSINNIPLRHLQASKTFSLDSIISVDGDDILCSVKGMKYVHEALVKGAQYVKTINLPFGMNSMGYTKDFLESSLKNYSGDALEMGWGRIFDQDQMEEIGMSFPANNHPLRFTLDYEEDYRFFQSIIEAFGEKILTAQDGEIVNLVVDKKLYTINEPISKQYWENFYKEQKKEMKDSTTIR